MDEDARDKLSYWSIHGSSLYEMMERAAAGEDPDIIYAEFYANAESHDVPGDEE